ncbi:Two-component system protein B [Lachnellula suecica]|uniref:histidine kinase n=1 Tax=Lachnellula suecica TaxID=602035 RepID=A0A8T9CBB4_9HELO|nr:Two-component system protein B [Lachnellula suecica]
MRIGIREQLGLVVLLTALVPLAVLAIATWINNHNFVVGVTSESLSLTASLKAAQVASDLLLIQSTCSTITTRILIQAAIKSFYQGNETATDTIDPSNDAYSDVSSALVAGGLSALLQVSVFSRNATGNPTGILRTTGNTSTIYLPTTYPNGSLVPLGDTDFGYPAALYPNITYNASTNTPDPMDPSVNATIVNAFPDFPMNKSSVLLLGPMQINASFALLSITLPIVDLVNADVVLGFMTVVASASPLIDIINSREGLANTGTVLIVGPSRRENQFAYANRPTDGNYIPDPAVLAGAKVKFIFPPGSVGNRHKAYLSNLSAYGASNFSMGAYPAAVIGFGKNNSAINYAGSQLTTKNENNVSVSVGFARPNTPLADWLLIVEQSHAEAWAPVTKLRKIVVATVLGTMGFIILVVSPIAHFSVRPIRRLRDATEKSISPPGYTPNGGSIRSERLEDDFSDGEPDLERRDSSHKFKKGILVKLRNLTTGGHRKTKGERSEEERRRVFKIPGKVQDRKHWVTDELTELTTTFNSMSDELMFQYQGLEEKVAERTHELEISKKAAEAANESKTLFIANISHELKTPLNGILGMCAVCLAEEDLPRIKRSLQVVYKSGDLLLHLLNDLLTFSKNQIGQHLTLEEKEFRLSDIKTQILTIFMKQVQEKNIDFSVRFVGADTEENLDQTSEKVLPALGPQGAGRLKDMCLWGDQHRILQVVINLVSNSLKFTPEGGKVEVRIKCLGEAETISDGTRNSMGSKQSSQRASRGRHGSGSNSQISRNTSSAAGKPAGTALLINPMDPGATPRLHVRERSPTPPPSNARTLVFQFEVQDTGPGIPEHLQERVFEPFMQGDLGLSKKFGGTGLGLSICSQLAGLMGGSITLLSSQETPSGTTFTMKIPLKHTKSRAPSTSSSDMQGSRPGSVYATGNAQTDGPQSPMGEPRKSSDFEQDTQPRLIGLSQPFFAAVPSSSPKVDPKEPLGTLAKASKESARKIRVLVAEDNLVNQEIVIRMLKLEDIYDVEVVVAKDGKEAYDIVKDSMDKGQYFNLIFMDIQMPNLDGLQSTRLIRQMGYSAPIVALTAFSEESNVKECYDSGKDSCSPQPSLSLTKKSGMDHFLSKPIRRPALKQVLKKFATIPEETETSSVSGKTTPPREAEASASPGLHNPPISPLSNGTSQP